MTDDKPHRTMGDIINKILISRGARKEKYSKKVRKVRMAGPQDLSPEQLNIINNGLRKGVLYLFFVDENSAPLKSPAPLSSKQMDIISLLVGPEGSVTKLKNYSGLNKDEVDLLIEDEDYKDLLEQHLNNIAEAVSAGLIWHPLVSEFIYTYKVLGNKEILRAIRRGWETGVKRPLTINDLQFRNRLEKIYKYRKEGETWLQIRRTLMKRKIINKMSWQALQKKFKKAWEEEWKKVNKKAPPIP